MPKGTIKKLMDHGYGFIKGDQEEELFFHRNELDGVEFTNLRVEQEVEFEIGQDAKNRPQAVKVRLAETQADVDIGDVGDSGGGDVG